MLETLDHTIRMNKIKSCWLVYHQNKEFYIIMRWSSPYLVKDCLGRILRLQERAARIILDADSRASSVHLFNHLRRLPFYNHTMIAQCSVVLKRIQLVVPAHLMESLRFNSSVHSRNTRFSNCNFISPRYKSYNRVTEGGRSFVVTATQYWNSLPRGDLGIFVTSFRAP